jgi:niacin transporter
MVAPRIVIGELASYTLASHVAIFIAMFIAPSVAVSVTIGTTLGFFIGGFPLVIVFRAASHIIWALPAALYLSRIDKFNISWVKLRVLSFIIAIVHAAGELIAVSLYYFGSGWPPGIGFTWLLGFVGLGTVIHSMVDLEIANVVRLGLQTQSSYRALASGKK